ncbi:MAG TPA: response regulator [Chthoniobacter sp.]|jgi:CheY-like chemotaxis protein
MVGKHPIIFLVEDCPDTALLIERGVMHEMPDVRILWARSLAEATARAAGLAIDLFLVDIGLPDGNGLDFLWMMAAERPNARFIVMTAFPLPEHRAHSEALGVLHFLEKPIQFRPIIDHLRAALDKKEEVERSDFRATLHNVTPADILQFKCLTGATTVVEFLSGENVGWIRFEEGQLTDAAAGKLRGVEAVYEIVAWKTGQVSERPCVGFFERTIHTPWHSLLMDAAHRLDERCTATAS